MPGAFDPVRHGSSPGSPPGTWADGPRRLPMHASPTQRATGFLALLGQLGAARGTAERARPPVAVLDTGPIRRSRLTTRAIAARPWLAVKRLPRYAPELSDLASPPGQAIQRCRRDRKPHQRANRTVADPGALDRAPLTPPPSTTRNNPIHRLFPYSLLRAYPDR